MVYDRWSVAYIEYTVCIQHELASLVECYLEHNNASKFVECEVRMGNVPCTFRMYFFLVKTLLKRCDGIQSALESLMIDIKIVRIINNTCTVLSSFQITTQGITRRNEAKRTCDYCRMPWQKEASYS